MGRPNPSLIKYIEKHLEKGFKIKLIKKRLAEAGHPIEAIEDAATFVLGTAPPSKKRIPKFMLIYGGILILIISVGLLFFWFKATQVAEYVEVKSVVENTLEMNSKFGSMSDIDLLKFAAQSNDLSSCEFIEDHNMYYACTDKYWDRDDCIYEDLIGEGEECLNNKAIEEKDVSLCSNQNCVSKLGELSFKDKNISYCFGSSDCIDEFIYLSSTTSDCDYLSSFDKVLCYNSIAIKKIDFTICETFLDIEDKKTCYIGSTKYHNFIDLDESCVDYPHSMIVNLSDLDNMLICESHRASKNSNLNYCNNMDINLESGVDSDILTYSSDFCKLAVIINNNIDSCDSITSNDVKNVCLELTKNIPSSDNSLFFDFSKNLDKSCEFNEKSFVQKFYCIFVLKSNLYVSDIVRLSNSSSISR